MTPEQPERYSRHVLLAPIGEAGQQRLLDAHVFVQGAGGLGSPATMYPLFSHMYSLCTNALTSSHVTPVWK